MRVWHAEVVELLATKTGAASSASVNGAGGAAAGAAMRAAVRAVVRARDALSVRTGEAPRSTSRQLRHCAGIRRMSAPGWSVPSADSRSPLATTAPLAVGPIAGRGREEPLRSADAIQSCAWCLRREVAVA